MNFLEFGKELFLIVCFRCQMKPTPSDAIDLVTRCAYMWTFLYACLQYLCGCVGVSVVRYKGSCSARLGTSGSPSCNMAHVITR